MSSPPKTRPETWVPAGAEKGVRCEPGTRGRSHRATRSSPSPRLPPEEEPRSRRRIPRLRRHATNLVWALLAAAVPVGVVPGARPGIRDAADRAGHPGPGRRRRSSAWPSPCWTSAGSRTLIVARVGRRVRVGDDLRSARRDARARHPSRPMRIASLAVDGTNADADAVLRSVAGLKADLLIVVEPSKKARNALRRGRIAIAFTLIERARRRAVIRSRARAAAPQAAAVGPHRSAAGRPPGGCVHRVRRPRRRLAPGSTLERPAGRRRRCADAASEERLPVVLAGDFGFTDRSTEYRIFDGRRSATRCARTRTRRTPRPRSRGRSCTCGPASCSRRPRGARRRRGRST